VQLALADERIGDEQIVDAGLDHHLRLAELRDGDAPGPGVQLHPREQRRLVRLGVGPEGDAGLVRDRDHLRDVPLDHVEVEQQRRRIDVRERGHRCGR
jgi:hypothetical protein